MPIATIPASRRDKHHDMIGSIHREIAASGELKLLAAIVAKGIEDARTGDVEAFAWLRSRDCLRIVERVTPPQLDPEHVQRAIVDAASA